MKEVESGHTTYVFLYKFFGQFIAENEIQLNPVLAASTRMWNMVSDFKQ